MTTSALERVIRRGGTRPVAGAERCELCNAPVADEHRHLLDGESEELLCVCRPCSVLFGRDQASPGRYRLVPERRTRLEGLSPAALGVPVGLAFFVLRQDGTVHAHYPSPAGATRWDVDRDTWRAAVAATPGLDTLAAGVEALLVNTARGRSEAWLVPVDDCYRLVGAVRRHWRGLYGGDRVWEEINRFFEELRRRHGSDPRG